MNEGYHLAEIPKGIFGEFSKIKEEFTEVEDAFNQSNHIMLLLELSDLIGAIEEFCVLKHNISLDDLIKMKNATSKAFKSGYRKG